MPRDALAPPADPGTPETSAIAEEVVEPLMSDLDVQELQLLRALSRDDDVVLPPLAVERLAELEVLAERAVQAWEADQERLHEMWRGIHAHLDEVTREWGPTLTPTLVDQLDRRSAAGESLSHDEQMQWVAAVELAKPKSRRDWRRYYKTPIAKIIFRSQRARAQSSARGQRPRRRGTRRATARRGPPREPREPEPPQVARSRGLVVVPHYLKEVAGMKATPNPRRRVQTHDHDLLVEVDARRQVDHAVDTYKKKLKTGGFAKFTAPNSVQRR